MKEWKKLEGDLIIWLKSLSELHELEFRNSYQAIIGFPSDGFRSDGMLVVNNNLIAIEVEAGQNHPDTNTGKYWFLYDKYKKYNRILLFHIYTPMFNSYNWRKELAGFYIEKMREIVPIEYILLDYRKSNSYQEVLENSKKEIIIKIEKLIKTLPNKGS